jgi:hypothetical protein
MNFLKKLLGNGCSHRFAWPRVDADGRHYQICLACGTAYEYDWETMRRTGPLPAATHDVESVLMLPTH